MSKPHILAVHLLNDRSGSPLVLRQALEVLAEAGYTIDLLTATPGAPGFLSHLPGATTHALPYHWSSQAWRTLLHFVAVQWLIFWKVLHLASPSSIVYVNTLLPAGAALAARCRGAQVVYHLHEVSLRPALLRRLLCAVATHTAHHVLYVSEHVRTTLALPVARHAVIYNALSSTFIAEANKSVLPSHRPVPFIVLMACSLRDYKGVPEFLALARSLPELQFELVLNVGPEVVAHYRAQHLVPANLTVFAAAHDMHPHYRRAAVVVNLSRPDEWVETFGMTVLEAFSYGRPVIVPPVGGVSEVNVHTQTGFAINGRELTSLQQALRLLAHNGNCYARMAAAARQRATAFAPSRFAEEVRHVFLAVQPIARTAERPAPVPSSPLLLTPSSLAND